MRNDAGLDEAVETQRSRGLECGDAERRVVELDALLVVVMRRVIGGDDVDAAVGEAGEHRIAIRGLAQRRGRFFLWVGRGWRAGRLLRANGKNRRGLRPDARGPAASPTHP